MEHYYSLLRSGLSISCAANGEHDLVIRVRFRQIVISDGTVVALPASGVTLFVGPNNAGKSQALRDLLGLIGTPQSYKGRAVTTVEIDKQGSNEDLQAWAEEHIPATRDPSGQLVRAFGEYGVVPAANVRSAWDQPFLQHIAPLFVHHADATSRLTAANPVPNIDFAVQPIQHPLQRAYLEPEVERQLRLASLRAFRVEVVLDRYAGSVISLRVGTPPAFAHTNGAPTPAYISALHELSPLEQQGDGMRSYLGLLLHILAGAHQITLVDEPEAFLHPPQARLLGRTLAQRSADSQQLFMATHSVDVVQGVLDSGAATTIVRITRDREGEVNMAAVLDPDQVHELWSDPLLRYSNLLDGLFHDAVILCEGDADCRYYGSVFDSLYPDNEDEGAASGPPKPQLLFSHCGGKGRLANVTRSLRAISIPVVIIADFDILNDEALLRRTVIALGADFEPMTSNLSRLSAALTATTKPVSKVALREALFEALEAVSAASVTKKDADNLRAVIRVDSGWDKVKQAGLSGVPQGSAYESCVALLAQLRGVGLLVVPVGELERFVPAVGGHGPAWVTEVHERKLHDDTTNDLPRAFLREVVLATSRATAKP